MSNISAANPPILIVEDDPDHVAILEQVIRRAGIANPIMAVGDGAAATSYLADRDPMSPRADSMPVLVLLDLGLPDIDGLEILALIRRQYDQARLPVVVLSGSGSSADIDRAFELGANSYLVKPVAFDALIDTLENLGLSRILLPLPADDDR